MRVPLVRLAAAVVVLVVASGLVVTRRDAVPTEVLPGRAFALAKDLAPDRARGVVLDGLRLVSTGRCANALLAVRSQRCAHGPDPAPDGVDVSRSQAPARTTAAEGGPQGMQAASGGGIACAGDGASGKRVQAIYARASDRTDRYSTYAPSIRTWAANVDSAFDSSAAKTGGTRRVRYVHDASCVLDVQNVVLPASGDDNLDNTIAELSARGYNRSDRMYLVWMDANVYCGIATLWVDERPGQENYNNSGASYGRIDSGCWGLWPSVEAHELMHTLGGVQPGAPNSTGGHCTDEYDRMCYQDGSGAPLSYLCPDASLDALFDCNNDDYFNTSPPPGSYLANNWNVARSAFLVEGQPPAPQLGLYSPLTPSRVLDTRNGTGAPQAPIAGGSVAVVQLTGRGGVPSSGVSAVVLNATVTNPTEAGYATVYPSGAPRPVASNVNFGGGQTVANLVLARVGSGGRVNVFVSSGRADVVFDVAGWYSDSTSGSAGRYRALSPARVHDTRTGARLGPGGVIDVQVTGAGGVPASGVSGVVLNVTATGPTQSSYLTVWPTGSARPTASNLNFEAGRTVPNRVFARVGTNGRVSVFNASGTVDVVLDVAGWFTDSSGASSPPGATTGLTPARVLDTRAGIGGISGRLVQGLSYTVDVAGSGGVPQAGATAAVLNVTVTSPTAAGYVTVYPGGASSPPLASDLNFVAGQTVPNLVVATLGPDGAVKVYVSAGEAHVIFDVVGYVA